MATSDQRSSQSAEKEIPSSLAESPSAREMLALLRKGVEGREKEFASHGEEWFILYNLLKQSGIRAEEHLNINGLREQFKQERSDLFGFYFDNNTWHTQDQDLEEVDFLTALEKNPDQLSTPSVQRIRDRFNALPH